jgi:hypothetical protein
MDHSEEAVGELIVDFQPPKHALDAVALLVEIPVMVDGAALNDSLYVAACEIGADGVGIITPSPFVL